MLKQVFMRQGFHSLGHTICLQWCPNTAITLLLTLLPLPSEQNTFPELLRRVSATVLHKGSAPTKNMA